MIADAALRLWVDFGAATPTPTPGPKADMVTPGVLGFLIMFLIAVATVLLIIDMTRRVRRVRYRAEVAEQLDAEEQAERQKSTDQPS